MAQQEVEHRVSNCPQSPAGFQGVVESFVELYSEELVMQGFKIRHDIILATNGLLVTVRREAKFPVCLLRLCSGWGGWRVQQIVLLDDLPGFFSFLCSQSSDGVDGAT